jgi:hypothetical protein
MAKRDRYGQNPYGGVHQKERKRWMRLVRAGGVDCWRCGKQIPVGSRWDLGHVDEEGRARGLPSRHPEHIRCNRATLPRMLAKARGGNGSRQRPRFADLPDPDPSNSVERWSRHWSGGFNPRCPRCRELGEACEDAERAA